MKHVRQQQTLALVKPDGVMRGLVGEVLSRIERRGLKVVALKMVQVERDHLEKHFPSDPEWVARLGDKGLKTFAEYNLDVIEYMGTNDRAEIGKKVKESLYDYMTSGPIVAMVIEGLHAIDMVRKVAGHTLPVFAEMGTIRGDFSVDSPAIANTENRAIHNIMHASETPEEAAHEIKHWFGGDSEIFSYKRFGIDE
jgi:nucleoside-diphosphate kinase